MKKSWNDWIVLPALGLYLMGTGCSEAAEGSRSRSRSAGTTNPPARLTVNEAPVSKETKQFSFAPVAKRVGPSVVNIYSTTTIKDRGMNPLLDDPLLRRFFGDRRWLYPHRQPRR
jgi:S1-C subfamily serine protease